MGIMQIKNEIAGAKIKPKKPKAEKLTLFQKAKKGISDRIGEELDFRKKVNTARKDAFKKSKLVEARREGRERAKKRPFDKIGHNIGKASGGGYDDDNRYLLGTSRGPDNSFGSGLRSELLGERKPRKPGNFGGY